MRYKSDCEELYGRILDNANAVSSIQGICASKTKEIWSRVYEEEPYELDLTAALTEDISEKMSRLEKCTTYDLVSAVRRQSPFFYQVIQQDTVSLLVKVKIPSLVLNLADAYK